MHPLNLGDSIWLLLLTAMCSLWQLQSTRANRQNQQNTNPAITQFRTNADNLRQCFEKMIYARSRSPAAVYHSIGGTTTIGGMTLAVPKPIKYLKVEALDDTYGGATVELIGGAIDTDNVVLSIADGNKKSHFKSNIMVTMFCAP